MCVSVCVYLCVCLAAGCPRRAWEVTNEVTWFYHVATGRGLLLYKEPMWANKITGTVPYSQFPVSQLAFSFSLLNCYWQINCTLKNLIRTTRSKLLFCNHSTACLLSYLNVTAVCVCLSDLSVRKRFLRPNHPSATTWWFTVLVVWWNINSPPSFLPQKFRRRVQESTQVLRELEISLRTNHIGWVTVGLCEACIVLNVEDLVVIDSRGKSLTFQTPGDADVDTNHYHHYHYHPPFISAAPA